MSGACMELPALRIRVHHCIIASVVRFSMCGLCAPPRDNQHHITTYIHTTYHTGTYVPHTQHDASIGEHNVQVPGPACGCSQRPMLGGEQCVSTLCRGQCRASLRYVHAPCIPWSDGQCSAAAGSIYYPENPRHAPPIRGKRWANTTGPHSPPCSAGS